MNYSAICGAGAAEGLGGWVLRVKMRTKEFCLLLLTSP